MCTLIMGLGVLGSGSFVVGANRDEDPGRPSLAPALLESNPPVVGGRDRLAGGTWFAIRDGRAVVAVFNRRPVRPSERRGSSHDADLDPRSRGLLALDVATSDPEVSGDAYAASALAEAEKSTRENRYAPFSLVCVTERVGWVMSHADAGPVRVQSLTPGWHIITHADLDDSSEPRTRRLLQAVERWQAAGVDQAVERMFELLSLHDEAGAGPGTPGPGTAVCIHEGRMVTVSSSVFARHGEEARYVHVEGRPCTGSRIDLTPLLSVARRAEPRV
jgi:uncharacterized protein with NRDE domain